MTASVSNMKEARCSTCAGEVDQPHEPTYMVVDTRGNWLLCAKCYITRGQDNG